MDIATLGIAVDSRQVKAGASDLDNLAQKGEKAEKSTRKLGDATAILSRLYKDLAAAAASWKLYDLVRDSATLAARYETMGVVMRVAGNNAGYTNAQMLELEKSLQKTGISMLQSRNALTQLATASIDLAKATELARTAQDVAVVGNVNSSEALARLIQGIKSGESEVLRTLGLNVSFEASYKKLALQLGTTSDKLSEHQKMIARTNVVLEEGKRYAGIYEESMTTAGKAITSLTRYWEDLKVKAGEAFLPALADAVWKLTDALKDANKELDKAGSEGTISAIGKGLSAAFRVVYETVAILAYNVKYVFDGIGREIAARLAQSSAVWEAWKGSGALSLGDFIDRMKAGFAKAGAIGDALRADNTAAEAALSAFEARVLEGEKAQQAASKMTEDERIAAAAASQKAQEAEAKRLRASEEATKAAKKEEEAYQSLRKAIGEKLAVARLDSEEQERLTEGQKLAAKFVIDIASGHLKLTDAHKARITALLEELIAQEKLNEAMKGQAEAQKYIDELNSKFGRDNTAKQAGFTVESESARRLREELDKVDDAARTVHENIIRMWGDGKLSPRAYEAAFESLNEVIAEQKKRVAELAAEQDRLNGSWQYGAENALQKYIDSAKNVASQSERLFSNAFQNMEDALVQFAQTGKLNFSKLADGIIADLIRIQIRMAMMAAMQGAGGSDLFGTLFGAALNFFSPGSGASSSASSGATNVYQDASTNIAHSGGIVGRSALSSRMVDASVFAGAPRFHGGGWPGLANDEVPIIAQKGERVLSRQEVAAGAGGPPRVDVTIHNSVSDKAQATVQARENNGRLELEVMVSEVVNKDLANNGPISQGLGATFGLERQAF